MGKISDIYSELKLDLSDFHSGISKATAEASSLGSKLSDAFGSNFSNDVRKASSELEELGNTAAGVGKDIGKIVSGILISQGFYKLTGAIQSAVGEVFNFQKATDTAAISFKTLLGDAEKAEVFLNQLAKYAAETPFELDNIRDYSRKLLAAGMAAKDVIPTMTTLGDAVTVAGGSADTLNRIVDVIVKIKAQGRLTAREVNRIAQSGIEIYPILREQLGLTAEEIAELGKQGIDADTAISAILKGWQEKFGGASEQISKTLDGIISNIKDNFVLIMSDLFEKPYEAVRSVMEKIGNEFDTMREIVSQQGAGGLLEYLVPPDLQDKVRVLVIEIGQLGGIIRDVGIIAAQGFRPLLDILYLLEPIIAAVAQLIHFVAEAAANGSAWVRILVGALSGLFILNKLSSLIINFRKAIMSLKIVAQIAGMIRNLAGTFQLLSAAVLTNPIAAGIAVIAAALLALVVSSDKVSQALDGVMERLAKIFGVDIGQMLQPEEAGDAMAKIENLGKDSGLDQVGKDLGDIGENGKKAGKGGKDAGKGMKNAGKEAAKANKEMRDFLFSFDEVYRIPEEKDNKKKPGGGKGGGKGKGDGDGPGDIGDLDSSLSNMASKAKRGAHDVGESIKDQLEKMPPIVLPGFVWPPIPPVPEIAFEPAMDPFIQSLKVKIPRAIDDLVIYLQQVPALVREAWEPLGDILQQPFIDLPLVTIPALDAWSVHTRGTISDWVEDTLGTLNGWATQAAEAVNSFTAPTLEAIDTWTLEMVATIGTFAEPTLILLNDWAENAAAAISGFTLPSKQELADWADSTIGTLQGWAANVKPALDIGLVAGLASIVGFAIQSKTELEKWSPNTSAIFSGWALVSKNTMNVWAADTTAGVKSWASNTNSQFNSWRSSAYGTINGWAGDTSGRVREWIQDTLNRYRQWDNQTNQQLVTWSNRQLSSFSSWASNTGQAISNWCSQQYSNFKQWDSRTSETIRSWVLTNASKFGSWVSDTVGKIMGWNSKQNSTVNNFKTSTGKTITDWAGNVSRTMSPDGGMKPSVNATQNTTFSMRDKFRTFAILTVGMLGKEFVPKASNSVGGASAVGQMSGSAAAFFAPLSLMSKNHTADAAKTISSLGPKISGMKSSIASAARTMASGFAEAWSKAVSKVKSWLSNLGSGGGGNISVSASGGGPMNHMASGGMISKNQFIEIGENNKKETVVPLQNPKALAPVYDYIDTTVRNAVGSGGGGQGSSLRPLYVGTLVADERGLKELHRKFQMYDVEEDERRGH